MKKLIYFLLGVEILTGITACQKDFLQKPETTGNTTVESVFASKVTAEGAIAAAYRETLVQNLWNGRSIDNGTLSGISGEMAYGETWATLARYVSAGFSPIAYQNNRAQSSDNFFDSFSSVRRSFIVYENIDKVPDMDAAAKENTKGEMKALVAYRSMGMFIHYGGIPLIDKVLTTDDNLNIPRATLQQTLDYIIKTSDEATALLPNHWEAKYTGRFTKGAAMAVKAKTLMYAARPLFNSATPYLNFGANNNLICFGSADQKRWDDAITANEAVITWAKANGYGIINTGGGVGIPNINAFDDYGNATSTPSNKEVLLAYKLNEGGSKFFRFYNPTRNLGSHTGNAERYLIDHYGMLSNFLPNYYKKDGTNFTWPGIGLANALPYADYAAKMEDMEPRFKADNFAHGFNAWNNPGNSVWTYVNISTGSNNPGGEAYGHGVAQSVKYYYKAGSRLWFEYPLFRLAEFYLNLAEAYNEVGNTAKALENLNVIHNRAGLPSITETNKDNLRKLIQREWAVEFYNENHRFFDVKHWKLADIGNGIMGGGMREFQFVLKKKENGANEDNRVAANYLSYYDQQTYSAYWDPKMYLDPFPQEEIDKRVIIQNPGY
jgi:hypothetical protein